MVAASAQGREPMTGQVRVLLVSGSTRSGSGNTAALATAAATAPGRVAAVLYDGLAGLPAFNPDDDADRLPDAAAELRDQIDALASVLGYVGAVIVEAACRDIPVDRAVIGPAGTVTDPGFAAGAAEVWNALLGHLDQAGSRS